MKLNKEAYEQLISEDIKALNEQMPHCAESSHIESVLKHSIQFYYPERISTVQDCELAVAETKKKAIEVYKNTCSFIPDGCCMIKKEAGKCDCDNLKDFIEELNS